MPRRQFVADLQKAQQAVLPAGIHDLQSGEDDGQFKFLFAIDEPGGKASAVEITALIPELSDYPASHNYYVYSGELAPPAVSAAVENMQSAGGGKTVFELLEMVSANLTRLQPDQDGDLSMPDSQIDEYADSNDEDDDDDDDDIYDSDHEAFGGDSHSASSGEPTLRQQQMRQVNRAFRARIRYDLRTAKIAGFKVGVLGSVLEGYNAFVTVSIRMSKLGISDEAMQAWQVDPTDYLILIIQYPNGYKTNEELQGLDSPRLAPNIGMRVAAGKKYKPTLQEATQSFTVAKKRPGDGILPSSELPQSGEGDKTNSIKETFISKSLASLLQDRLVPVLRFRSAGMSWGGAEDFYRQQANASGRGDTDRDRVPDTCYQPEAINPALPDVAKADHYKSSTLSSSTLSFPLLAMQYLIRHFARCTEFCLVCHRKMDSDLEAIKPYVCDDGLCLYQYMTLGFGPSIEHEVLAQPYVVDILVSFCYNSAYASRLKEFPDGLSLTVPPIDTLGQVGGSSSYVAGSPQVAKNPVPTPDLSTAFEVGLDRSRLEMIFFKKPEACPVRRGDWIVVKSEGTLQEGQQEMHCRIAETSYYPTITVSEPIVINRHNSANAAQTQNAESYIPQHAKPATPVTTPSWTPATFQLYQEDFKNLSTAQKLAAICKLLDTLPSVKAMQRYILSNPPADLRNWGDRISPAALSLLRWIVASNRACIMQVDGDTQYSTGTQSQERVHGMKDYIQFRFAMGAPDKEQRFISEVRNTAERLKLKHPTIFAWHGSPLCNWHMIIREGLHFKNVDNGRAHGNGVYHAKDVSVSSGYSSRRYGGSGTPDMWTNSVLQVSTALALNEIVNAPAEFVSQHPYYVVPQLDWIQTRYLFVKCDPTLDGIRIPVEKIPDSALAQDPQRTPYGTGSAIAIPASAVKTGKYAYGARNRTTPSKESPIKKLKRFGSSSANPISLDDDDASSDTTDASDIEIIFGEDPEPTESTPSTAVSKRPILTTDFVPGTLDCTTLPLMPVPTYANSPTTTRLMGEINRLQKLQDSIAPADLGWHLDTSKLDNVYQWIVELHSFQHFRVHDQPLPLVADMKAQNLKSIVCEVRFNHDFPFSPPYIRVIRPRFLGFNQGGGGHIVLGGAMCMEMLTNSGWSGVLAMEGVLMQVRMAIASEPFARLDARGRGDYGAAEAADGYVRACRTHGWAVPKGFEMMARGGGAEGL